MHESMKSIMGINKANCETCSHLGTEDDGNWPEYAISWSVCRKFPKFEHLKPFPFKKERPCWEPEFWQSKFAERIKHGEDWEVLMLIENFVVAREYVGREYEHMWQ